MGFGCEWVRLRKLRACLCLEIVVLEYNGSMRKALPVAGLGNYSFGVQAQYAERSSSDRAWNLLFCNTFQYTERSSSGRAWKLLFWSTNSVRRTLFHRKLLLWNTNSVRGMIFQWLGSETAVLKHKISMRNALPVAWI